MYSKPCENKTYKINCIYNKKGMDFEDIIKYNVERIFSGTVKKEPIIRKKPIVITNSKEESK